MQETDKQTYVQDIVTLEIMMCVRGRQSAEEKESSSVGDGDLEKKANKQGTENSVM